RCGGQSGSRTVRGRQHFVNNFIASCDRFSMGLVPSLPVLTGSSTEFVHPSDSGIVEARDRWTALERAPERPAEERATAQVGLGEWRTRKYSPRDTWLLMPGKKGGTAGLDAA